MELEMTIADSILTRASCAVSNIEEAILMRRSGVMSL